MNKMSDIFKKYAYSAVEGNTGLIRDNHSKAIINTDEIQREENRKRRKLLKQRMNEIKVLNEEQQSKISCLEREVENLKVLVHKILES
jgi:hypothetical protein